MDDQNKHIGNKVNKDQKITKSLWKNPFLWGGLIVVCLVSGVAAKILMVEKSPENSSSVLKNSFGEQAKAIGANQCAPLLSNLGAIITQGSNFTASTFWNEDSPNQHAVSAIVGQIYGNQDKGTGVVYTAPVSGGCEGTMVRTVLTKSSCATVVKEQLPQGTQRQSDLNGIANFRLSTGGNVMLIPASEESCVVVTAINLADQKK